MNKEKGTGSSLPSKRFIEVNNLLKTSAKCTGKRTTVVEICKKHKCSNALRKSCADLITSC